MWVFFKVIKNKSHISAAKTNQIFMVSVWSWPQEGHICHKGPSMGASIVTVFCFSFLLEPWERETRFPVIDEPPTTLIPCNFLTHLQSLTNGSFLERATGWWAAETTRLSIREDEQPWRSGSAAQKLQRRRYRSRGLLGLKQINQKSDWAV